VSQKCQNRPSLFSVKFEFDHDHEARARTKTKQKQNKNKTKTKQKQNKNKTKQTNNREKSRTVSIEICLKATQQLGNIDDWLSTANRDTKNATRRDGHQGQRPSDRYRQA